MVVGIYNASSKKNTPCFDPSVERVIVRPIWVKLAALPLEIWNKCMLKEIGNNIEVFLVFDQDSRNSMMKSMAQVLVEMDLGLGFLDRVETQLGN
jgi:hypothetical protein